jgi:hypothetical protein
MSRGGPPAARQEPGEKPKVQMIEPSAFRPYIEIDRIEGHAKKKVTFKLRLNGIDRTKCTVKYSSTRGGVVSKDIVIGK